MLINYVCIKNWHNFRNYFHKRPRQRRRDLKQIVMKKSTKNRVRMFDTVRTVMMEHQNDWSGNQGFEAGVDLFNLKLEELKTAAARHSTIYNGVKTAQNTYIQAVCTKAMVLRNALEVFAHDNQLPSVYESIRFTETQLKRSSQQVLRDRLSRIYELTVEYESDLLIYGVTTTHISDFLDLYQDFENEIVALRIGIIERKMLTKRIITLENEVFLVLKKKVDVLMKLIAVEHPEFFEQYKSARIVIEKSNYRPKDEPPSGEEDIGFAS